MTVVVPPGPATNTCTLGTVKTALRARGWETDTDGFQTAVINDVYRELAGSRHWWWTEAAWAFSVVAGTSFYSLATIALTDMLYPQAARLTFSSSEKYNLRWMDPQEMRNRLYVDDVSRNIPQYWSYQAGQFVLYPEPDRAYVVDLDYIKDPVDLANDSDAPLFPAAFCPILVFGALAEMAARNRDWTMYDRYRARYDAIEKRMAAQAGIQQQQNSLQIGSSGLYDPVASRFYGSR